MDNKEAVLITQKLLLLLPKLKCEGYLPEGIFPEGTFKKLAKVIPLTDFASSMDLLVILGGDGTFLKGVRILDGTKIPVVGVRLGSLGFLTEIAKVDVEKELQRVVSGKYHIEERLKLRGEVMRKSKKVSTFHTLNDLVIHTAGLARISSYQIYLDGELFLHLNADGVLVASPTGSTAYSFAAGGSVVDPRMQALIVTPICPQNVIVRPMILSDTTQVDIKIVYKNSDLLLSADGQEQFSLQTGDTVRVSKSESKAYFLRSHPSNFFRTVKEKLFFEHL